MPQVSYGSKSLNDLRDEALRIATEHGFKNATIAEDIALFHSEASEMLEDHRAGEDVNKVWYEEKVPVVWNGEPVMFDGKQLVRIVRHDHLYPGSREAGWDIAHPYKPCGIGSEAADILIRLFHFSGKHSIDIEQRVREKMIYNDTREFMHGKKL